MDITKLREICIQEEKAAHIHGWDFSHINGRFAEELPPWDYCRIVRSQLKPEHRILDVDTGGGELLLSLGHSHKNTAATEGYPPNVRLCEEKLLPLGIDFRAADATGTLPYPDESFDRVLNRHGDVNPADMYRLLKPGGLFITQQVGAENDRELSELLCGQIPVPFPEQYLKILRKKLEAVGFVILRGEEAFCDIRFFDVGALTWFARIIQWEFPDFSVDTHLRQLENAQRILKETGSIDGKTHRFMLVAKKPG